MRAVPAPGSKIDVVFFFFPGWVEVVALAAGEIVKQRDKVNLAVFIERKDKLVLESPFSLQRLFHSQCRRSA